MDHDSRHPVNMAIQEDPKRMHHNAIAKRGGLQGVEWERWESI